MNKDKRFEPDYVDWFRRGYWRINEAASLLLNAEPDKTDELKELDEKFRTEYEKILAVAKTIEGIELYVIGKGSFSTSSGSYYAKVPPVDFVRWAQKNKYELPNPLLGFLDNCDEERLADDPIYEEANRSQLQSRVPDSKRNQRVKDIVLLAKNMFHDPLKIPDGGKKQLMKTLCELKSDLFTEDTFDAAWKSARKENLVKMENHDQFTTGK
jgi:hypothetical protein